MIASLPFIRRTGARAAGLAGSLALAAALSGCGLGGNFAASIAPTAAAAGVLSGTVHGGQQPVVGATIQLYAAGIPATGSGYGVGATPLLTSAVTTDGNGGFSITGKYTCPTPAQQVYIVATGGNPGFTGTVNNTGLAEMAALGTCPAGGTLVATNPIISISEVTTVAAVTALQQFMAAPATANKFAPNVGAPVTAYATGTTLGSVQSGVIGMNNAFITARVLADPSTGISPNANYAYATPETAKINTIADILSYCINSTGSDGACASLFAAATPTGKTAAADTIQAAWYMAQNPINNISALYNLIPPSPPYLPVFSAPGTLNSTSTGPATSAFNDTTIAINYSPTVATVPAVGAAYGIAIDSFGNAWVSNAGGIGGTPASAAELGVDGSALITPATTYNASATNGSTAQFTTALTAPSTRTFSAPKAVAIDLNNRAWIANYGDSYTATTAGAVAGSLGVFTGSTASGVNGASGGIGSTGYFVGDLPFGLAVDGSNNVFVAEAASISATILDGASIGQLVSAVGAATDGTYTYSTSGSTTAPARTPGSNINLAIDTNPNSTNGILWAIEQNGCKIQGQFNASTAFGAVGQYSNITPLNGANAVSAFSNASGPAAGSSTNCGSSSTYVGQTFTAATANPLGIAIDRNNGVWISDLFTSSTGFDGLTYLVAPTASTGSIPNSYYVVNGTIPTQTTAGTAGTTLTKAGMLAVDGNNNVWVGNQTGKSVVEATLSGSTITFLTPGQGGNYGTGAATGIGFVHNTVANTGVAIDPSGNVWLANNSTGSNTYTNQAGTAVNYGNSVTVVVGAAGPVITPLSLAIKNTKLGTRP